MTRGYCKCNYKPCQGKHDVDACPVAKDELPYGFVWIKS